MTTSFKMEEQGRLHAATSRIEQRVKALKRVDVEVDEKACEYAEAQKVNYSDAMDAVLSSDPDLAKRYRESFVATKK